MARVLTLNLLPAPIVHAPRCDLPVLLSVPHSGRDYPDWLTAMSATGRSSLEALEDPYVDRLAWRALKRGVGAVIAQTPRAAIDCNRAEDEVDPAVVVGALNAPLSAKTRGGLGLVPARTQRDGFLWRRAISRAQLDERIEQAHRPYHRAIERELAALRDRFGCALLLDCHSMPPPARDVAPVVFGDRHGRTCDSWVSVTASAIASDCGFDSGLNHPFAGGHVVDRHARPARGVQALQVEIDRRCYLDCALIAPGPGFDRAAVLIDRLAFGLGEELLRRQFATAAE